MNFTNFQVVTWPEVQDYMMQYPNFDSEVGYDSNKDVWFVPDEWVKDDW